MRAQRRRQREPELEVLGAAQGPSAQLLACARCRRQWRLAGGQRRRYRRLSRL